MNDNSCCSAAAHGGLYISDTISHHGDFAVIAAVEDAVVTLVSTNVTGLLSAVPIPAGGAIHGHFTSVTLASGKVFAYHTAPDSTAPREEISSVDVGSATAAQLRGKYFTIEDAAGPCACVLRPRRCHR